jgi:hypothetical protein
MLEIITIFEEKVGFLFFKFVGIRKFNSTCVEGVGSSAITARLVFDLFIYNCKGFRNAVMNFTYTSCQFPFIL